MPGYVMHLGCAEQVIDILGIRDSEWRNRFRLGSIVPDVCEKRASHFWDDVTYRKFTRSPNLDLFFGKYKEKMQDPFVFGYFAHLYLDFVFVEGYWREHFAFYDVDGKPDVGYETVQFVELLDNRSRYKREEFFSERLFYGDYDLLNPYIFWQYEVQIPVPEGDLRKVEESAVDVTDRKLVGMLESLKKLGQNDKRYLKPPLNILNLADLTSMIEAAAKEIARRYA